MSWPMAVYNICVIGLTAFCVLHTGSLWGLLALLFVATLEAKV